MNNGDGRHDEGSTGASPMGRRDLMKLGTGAVLASVAGTGAMAQRRPAQVSDAQRDQIRTGWSNIRAVQDIGEPLRTMATFGNPRPL